MKVIEHLYPILGVSTVLNVNKRKVKYHRGLCGWYTVLCA